MCCLYSMMALWYFGCSQKNIFSWENNIFEAIFSMFFKDENFKTCFDFYFPALETLLGTLKICLNNPVIANLEFETHGFLESHSGSNATLPLRFFRLWSTR